MQKIFDSWQFPPKRWKIVSHTVTNFEKTIQYAKNGTFSFFSFLWSISEITWEFFNSFRESLNCFSKLTAKLSCSSLAKRTSGNFLDSQEMFHIIMSREFPFLQFFYNATIIFRGRFLTKRNVSHINGERFLFFEFSIIEL